MQRLETRTERICRACQFENDLGCEIVGESFCKKCGAALDHEVLVTYEDFCPLCKVSFEEGDPHIFSPGPSGALRWLCQECWPTPRGQFYLNYHLYPLEPQPAPGCELCGAPSTMLPLTHSHPDGRHLCAGCAETETGKQWIKEHDEPSWPDPAEKERLERMRKLLRAAGVPFVDDTDQILVARSDAPSFVRAIFALRWQLEAIDGFTAESETDFRDRCDEYTAWWDEPEVPTESGVLAIIHSHPVEITHYQFFVGPEDREQ